MCNKMSFVSKADAMNDVKITRNGTRNLTRRSNNKKMRAYLCPECEAWHLTSNKRLKHHAFK